MESNLSRFGGVRPLFGREPTGEIPSLLLARDLNRVVAGTEWWPGTESNLCRSGGVRPFFGRKPTGEIPPGKGGLQDCACGHYPVKAKLMVMAIRPIFRLCVYLLATLAFGSVPALAFQSEEPSTDAIFADAPFEKWQTQGPRLDVPWQVRVSKGFSLHQRLVASIKVQIPGTELLKRSHDERITLLVEVRNSEGTPFRNYGLLELDNLKPETKNSDVEFSWQAFAVPGQYEVAVALWDKKSGEHNFLRLPFHIDTLKNDPLPEMWQGLDAFEFWSTKRDGPEFLFHSDIDGRLHLPLTTRRPVQLDVLVDLTPSAERFHGNYSVYNFYLATVLPLFKVFSQIKVANGSSSAAVLDIVQRRIPFEQNDGKDLDWPSLSKALSPSNDPGRVSVKELQNRQQNPVYLREEIVRRLTRTTDSAGQPVELPLHAFVLIGGPMELYVFPRLPEVETGREQDCVIYYLQVDSFEGPGATGAAGNVEKMLKPLKIHTIHVRTAFEARRALARVLEEIGKL